MRATALYHHRRKFSVSVICVGLALAAVAPELAAPAAAEDLCFIKLQPDAQGAISLNDIEGALKNCQPNSGLLIQANLGSIFDERSASLLAGEYCNLDRPVTLTTAYILCRYVKQRRIPTLEH